MFIEWLVILYDNGGVGYVELEFRKEGWVSEIFLGVVRKDL